MYEAGDAAGGGEVVEALSSGESRRVREPTNHNAVTKVDSYEYR